MFRSLGRVVISKQVLGESGVDILRIFFSKPGLEVVCARQT